ncbi:MAG: hypothetical protein CMP59_08635 [Flavobacteriales bacterium]|nr:hypothetical protein [Flavobacteriales bacterium]
MELILKNSSQNGAEGNQNPEVQLKDQQETKVKEQKAFIEANSKPIEIQQLKRDCIVPVFSKDNEVTISHDQFIECGMKAAKQALGVAVESPQIRVSHQIKGRTPDAINVPANELKESQKTLYFERMAWVARIPKIKTQIGGNELSLAIGGVRAYNQENLYSRKGVEKFKVFIGFQNMICLNLCISTDGLRSEIKTDNFQDLSEKLISLAGGFDFQREAESFRELEKHSITESQFATLIGKLRMYNHLPAGQKKELPEIQLTDNQFNMIAKDYYRSKSFCKDESGKINLWRLYNLITSANKSSYIDSFLGRNVNALDLVIGIKKAIDSESNYRWFIN